MANPISIALIGLQHYHANFWIKAILASDDAVVAGVWDQDPILANTFAHTYNVPAYTDRAALLEHCEAVGICSATSDHPALIEAAANAGRAILCEKPLAISEEETKAVFDCLERTGVRFMQSFPKRLDPVTQALQQIVQSDEIGRVTMVRVRHGHNHGFSPEFCRGWYVDPALSGGGTLLDEGVHAADFLRQVFGEPSAVTATISSDALGLPVEDTAIAVFTYDNGLVAEVATSWCFAAADESIEVYGTGGTILLSGVDIASRPTREADFLRVFKRTDEGGTWENHDIMPHFKTGVFHEHVAWAFIKALREGTDFPTTARDGARASSMIRAAYRAAHTGQRQTITYTDS